MTDKQKSEVRATAAALETLDMGGVADLVRRQRAENETLRTGYSAARLEIESLKAQSEGAQQPGVAYAALPDAPLSVFSKGHWTFKETGQNFSGAELDEAAFVAYRDRASHGQAPAQPAPAYKDSTPELHIGDSAFESWYSSYKPTHKGDKQRARDAYAAGMGDPLVMAAPTTQPAPPQEAQEPMAWHEQARAIREGNEIAASDKYFSARPQIVSADRRKVFRAGFERGWDAARAAQEVKSHDN